MRDKATTDEKVLQDEDLKDRTNIHIVEADVTDYAALKVTCYILSRDEQQSMGPMY